MHDPVNPQHKFMCDFDRVVYEIRPCDVLLIEGNSRISQVIRTITESPWTHACLYIGRLHDIENPLQRQKIKEHSNYSPDTPLVIESLLGKGTIVSPLDIYQDAHIRICRPNGVSRRDAQQIATFAISRLGVEYGIRQIFDLARFLMPWRIIPKRWRSSLFEKHPGIPTREICSSLIAEAFASIRYPILPIIESNRQKGIKLINRNHRLFTPKDFDYSPFFEIIKYPILPLGKEALYRYLPWDDKK